MGFLINSRIHPFIQCNPEMLACQASIGIAGHRFLNHRSYVDCNNLYEFEESGLTNNLGPVSEEAKKSIKQAVGNAKTVEPVYSRLILES